MVDNMIEMAGVGDVFQIERVGGKIVDGRVFLPVSYVQQFADNPDYLILVAEISRPGVQLFATKLEHLLFPPNTEANKLFQFGAYRWDACFGMPFIVMLFPSVVLEDARKIAEECDIKFANGVPTLLGGNPQVFPITGSSVFRLENLPGSKVYAGALNPDGGMQGYQERMETLLKEERDKTKEFLLQVGVSKKEIEDVLEA